MLFSQRQVQGPNGTGKGKQSSSLEGGVFGQRQVQGADATDKGNFACKILEGLKARRYSGFWRFATAKCRNALLVLPMSLF